MAIIASTGKLRNKIESLWRVADAAWYGRDVSTFDQAPDLLNGEFSLAVNAAGTGTVQMIGVNSSNQVVLPNGAILPSGSIGLNATVTLSSAQLLTLHSVPVPLLAAPPAGQAIFVEQLMFEMTTTATGYLLGGAIGPVYHSATTVITGNTVPASVVLAGAGTSYTLLALGAATSGLTVSSATGVDLYAATQDFTTGTGTAKVIVFYKIITL